MFQSLPIQLNVTPVSAGERKYKIYSLYQTKTILKKLTLISELKPELSLTLAQDFREKGFFNKIILHQNLRALEGARELIYENEDSSYLSPLSEFKSYGVGSRYS